MKILLTGLILICASIVFCADTVMVDNNGALAYPTKDEFYKKNIRVFQQDFRIHIDTTQSIGAHNTSTTQWWSDCEIKVIDKWGYLIYFTSTIMLNNAQVQYLHPEFCDNTPKIYYWKNTSYNSTGGCWGERQQLTNFSSSIGAQVGAYGVTAIWIYPSLDSTETRTISVYNGTTWVRKTVVWGQYLREVFTNPDNTILAWRQTTSTGEYYDGEEKLWRPVRLEFYGNFKEVRLQP